jgi:chemotaxis signal transduction protein
MATVKKKYLSISIPDFSKWFPMKKCKKEALTKVEIESVGSVQMTEKDRIISLKDLKAKEKLITEIISLRDRTVQFLDVEKTLQMLLLKMLLMN